MWHKGLQMPMAHPQQWVLLIRIHRNHAKVEMETNACIFHIPFGTRKALGFRKADASLVPLIAQGFSSEAASLLPSAWEGKARN